MGITGKIDREFWAKLGTILIFLNTVAVLINTSVLWLIPFTLALFSVSIYYLTPGNFYQKLEERGVIPRTGEIKKRLAILSPRKTLISQIDDEIEDSRQRMKLHVSQNRENCIQNTSKEIETILEEYGTKLNERQKSYLRDQVEREWDRVNEESE
jgi:hypothetical protein